MSRLTGAMAVIVVAGLASAARGQRVPFFSPGATSFEPEIGIVNTGIVQDVQAVVSADRKYVTLNMRAQNSSLLALREFTFQNGPPMGTVGLGPAASVGNRNTGRGGSGSGASGGGASGRTGASPVLTSPAAIRTAANRGILERHGMFRISEPE
jgi:hypothetical protein